MKVADNHTKLTLPVYKKGFKDEVQNLGFNLKNLAILVKRKDNDSKENKKKQQS